MLDMLETAVSIILRDHSARCFGLSGAHSDDRW